LQGNRNLAIDIAKRFNELLRKQNFSYFGESNVYIFGGFEAAKRKVVSIMLRPPSPKKGASLFRDPESFCIQFTMRIYGKIVVGK
jgi:hypothetical protein